MLDSEYGKWVLQLSRDMFYNGLVFKSESTGVLIYILYHTSHKKGV